MALVIYNAAILALLPVLVLALIWHTWVSGRLRSSWLFHLTWRLPAIPEGTPLVWLHAASVGETRAIEGLVLKLRTRNPGLQLLMTHTSPTGHALARSLGLADHYTFLPFDFPGLPGRFIDRVRPRALILAETEIWPNLLQACRSRGVPVVIVNGRLSSRWEPFYMRLCWLYRQFLDPVELFLMQGEEDATRLLALGVPGERVKVAGDLKADRTLQVAQAEDRGNVARELGLVGPVLVAGSVHSGEHLTVIGSFARLKKEIPELKLVLAPRHMDRLAVMRRTLDELGLGHRLRSAHKTIGAESVLILDTIGELASTYLAARVAFVGGSLVGAGGHSLFEPAACACPILIGPNDQNFREESRALREAGAAVRVENEDQFCEQARLWLTDEAAVRRAGEAARRVAISLAGATDRVLDALEPLLRGRR
ncbi:MAG: 3-deoxy-D-manno-octulosonic acid transferase [Candidatus Riflebacteria bacterium]|nr:3-deoxy-D-manno-octulosonic acid transferase [Candidatus Riflebacteria bacterium]